MTHFKFSEAGLISSLEMTTADCRVNHCTPCVYVECICVYDLVVASIVRERKPYTAMRRVPRSQEFTCALGQALPWVEEGISSLIHSTGRDGAPSLCRELFCMLEVETPVPLRASLF